MTATSPWLLPPIESSEAAVRLFCFPHAGGGASAFNAWRSSLQPDVEVFGVQLPGRENRLREVMPQTLGQLVVPIVEAINALHDQPFVAFGHSMGAILAFEVALQLRRSGANMPAALIVSGHSAPHIPSRAPRISHFPPGEALRLISERHGGVPAQVLQDAQLRTMMGKALQADLAILERYEHATEDPLSCPIIALGGSDDAWVNRSELDAWQRYTTGPFSCLQFRGGHFYFGTQEVQAAVLARIRQVCLEAGPYLRSGSK